MTTSRHTHRSSGRKPRHIRRLSFPLPRLDWYRTESGGWASRDWTKESIAHARLAGGWPQRYILKAAHEEDILESAQQDILEAVKATEGGYVL